MAEAAEQRQPDLSVQYFDLRDALEAGIRNEYVVTGFIEIGHEYWKKKVQDAVTAEEYERAQDNIEMAILFKDALEDQNRRVDLFREIGHDRENEIFSDTSKAVQIPETELPHIITNEEMVELMARKDKATAIREIWFDLANNYLPDYLREAAIE